MAFRSWVSKLSLQGAKAALRAGGEFQATATFEEVEMGKNCEVLRSDC